MIRFYAPDIAETLTLPESDSGHAVRVLRLGAGAELEVTDGQGRIYSCRIADPHPKHARVELTGVRDCPPVWTQEIAVAVAPTKHIDRMEWLVEKLVEIGISRFIPVLTSRSERKVITTFLLEAKKRGTRHKLSKLVYIFRLAVLDLFVKLTELYHATNSFSCASVIEEWKTKYPNR